jgi:hypothetical protein
MRIRGIGVVALGGLIVVALLIVTNTGQATAQPKEPIPYQVGTSRLQFLPSPPPGKVTMKLEFWWRNGYALPAPIRFHKPVGDQAKLWAMESLERGQTVAKGEEIRDGIIFVSPGEQRLVTLIFENPLDKAVAFHVVAPMYDPAGAVRRGVLRCLCAAFTFEVPAGGSWYRTIAVGVNRAERPGQKLIVMFPAIRTK